MENPDRKIIKGPWPRHDPTPKGLKLHRPLVLIPDRHELDALHYMKAPPPLTTQHPPCTQFAGDPLHKVAQHIRQAALELGIDPDTIMRTPAEVERERNALSQAIAPKRGWRDAFTFRGSVMGLCLAWGLVGAVAFSGPNPFHWGELAKLWLSGSLLAGLIYIVWQD